LFLEFETCFKKKHRIYYRIDSRIRSLSSRRFVSTDKYYCARKTIDHDVSMIKQPKQLYRFTTDFTVENRSIITPTMTITTTIIWLNTTRYIKGHKKVDEKNRLITRE